MLPGPVVSFFFLKQKTAYEVRISDWSSDVCSSDLRRVGFRLVVEPVRACRHDDLVALLFAEAIFAQHAALVLGALAARRTAAVVGALLGDQLVGRAVGEVVERLDPRLAEHDTHRFGQVRNIGQIIPTGRTYGRG